MSALYRLFIFSVLLTMHGLCQAIAFPRKDDDMGMVNEPVIQRGCQPIVTENRVPSAEFQVGCNDAALALIAIRNHLKQQLRSILVTRHKADFVYDHEFHAL